MKVSFTLFLIFLSSSLFSQTSSLGLKIGNKISLALMKGNLKVECRYDNGHTNVFYTCEQERFIPDNFSYFIGPKDNSLKKLDLIIQNNSKESYKMIGLRYKGKKGRSKYQLRLKRVSEIQSGQCDIFNPILPLKIGKNIIYYRLYNKNKTHEVKGSFIVTLKNAQKRDCKDGRMFSNRSSSCWQTYKERLCGMYFRQCLKR